MPEGSSSEAPVTRPGPRILTRRRTEGVLSVISATGRTLMRRSYRHRLGPLYRSGEGRVTAGREVDDDQGRADEEQDPCDLSSHRRDPGQPERPGDQTDDQEH